MSATRQKPATTQRNSRKGRKERKAQAQQQSSPAEQRQAAQAIPPSSARGMRAKEEKQLLQKGMVAWHVKEVAPGWRRRPETAP